MFVLIAGFLVSRGGASCQVDLVLVSICVNVLAVVKSSEVLVSLVSCAINTESVLNLRTTKTDRVSRCLLHLCHVRLVISVVLFSVRIATSKSCTW